MIHKFEFPYPPAQENRIIHLYLPDEYYNTDERYPVIYMFDGHNLFFDWDATYGKSWGMKSFLDQWDKRVIVVGFECSHTGNQRIVEYCPYNIWDKEVGSIRGIGEKTMDWIANDVKPYIDANYRTYSFREATAIGGSSMGGLMALYGVLKYNKVFSKSAVISPALFNRTKDIMKIIQTEELDPDTRVYVSWGKYEDRWGSLRRNVLKLDALMKEKELITDIVCQQDGNHCEADWERLVPDWLNFLWK